MLLRWVKENSCKLEYNTNSEPVKQIPESKKNINANSGILKIFYFEIGTELVRNTIVYENLVSNNCFDN